MEDNAIVSVDKISNVVPNWQHPIIPGHAYQGSILVSKNNFVNPPQSSSDFEWILMEELIGVHNVRLDFDEKTNKYTILQSQAHRKANGEWLEDWYSVGSFEMISEETQTILKSLVYVEYEFDTTTENTLKVNGIKKDGSKVNITTINFVSSQVLNNAVAQLTTLINQETTRAQAQENKIKPVGGTATSTTQGTDGTYINVVPDANKGISVDNNKVEAKIGSGLIFDVSGNIKPNISDGIKLDANAIKVDVDNSSIVVDNNHIKANLIDDSKTSSSDKTWSIDKIKQYHGRPYRPMGTVNNFAELPTTGQQDGDVWIVLNPTRKQWFWANNTWNDFGGSEYTAGAGIDITNNVISSTGVAFATGNGLKVEGTGTEATMSVMNDPNSPIAFNADKSMYVKVDNDTIKINDDKKLYATMQETQIDDETIKKTADKKLYANLNANGGLQVLNGICLKPADESITVDVNGIKANIPTYTGTAPISVGADKSVSIDYDTAMIKIISNKLSLQGSTETWTFTLTDGSTVNKKVRVF